MRFGHVLAVSGLFVMLLGVLYLWNVLPVP